MRPGLNRIKRFLKKPKVIIILAFLFVSGFIFWFCLPKPLFNSPTSYVIDDADGQLLGAIGIVDNVRDRKSTRLNSSHQIISYAVFCLKKKKINRRVCGTTIHLRGSCR